MLSYLELNLELRLITGFIELNIYTLNSSILSSLDPYIFKLSIFLGGVIHAKVSIATIDNYH